VGKGGSVIDIRLTKWFHVKAPKVYPWPCKPDPKRTFELWPDDVLTRSADGTYVKHSGLCMLGFVIPDEDIVEVNEPVRLVG
jgi:hypothetical protein